MSPERRIRSIPPRTALDVLRGGVRLRIGGGSLIGGVGRVPREPRAGEADWDQTVDKHLFQKPPRQAKARPQPLYERDGKIKWEVEVMEDYNNRGGLGIILQFDGIELTRAPFLRSRRYYGPDSAVFSTEVGYKSKTARLILATRGDIFESQIVQAQIDVNPFFQKELHLPQLTTTHDPTSMTVFRNNNLVTVSYNPLPTIL